MHVDNSRSSATVGVIQALMAYTWWGFISAIYYKVLSGFPAMELLAWRVITGAPLMLLLVALPPGIGRLRRALANRANIRILLFSTALIAINWFTFIYAVLNNRLMEASLGYFINPLVLVLLSRIVLREHMRPRQLLAIAIATLGVIVFAASMMFGGEDPAITQFPWISLALPISFGLYGLLRKKMEPDSVTGLTIEMLLIMPLMIGLELAFVGSGTTILMSGSPGLIVLLLLSGVVTIVPLICFAAAARRLRLTSRPLRSRGREPDERERDRRGAERRHEAPQRQVVASQSVEDVARDRRARDLKRGHQRTQQPHGGREVRRPEATREQSSLEW